MNQTIRYMEYFGEPVTRSMQIEHFRRYNVLNGITTGEASMAFAVFTGSAGSDPDPKYWFEHMLVDHCFSMADDA